MSKVLRAFVGTALSLCLVGTLALAATSAKSPKGTGITVEKFVVDLARAMNLKDAGTAEGASKALRGLGITFDEQGGLTEGQLVRALKVLGIRVRTSSPTALVSEAKAANVLKTFRAELTRAAAGTSLAGDTNPNDDFNNGNGKGGKFKRKANLSPGVPPGQTD
jgi:hypothetical protein